jgi:hypothetical protein
MWRSEAAVRRIHTIYTFRDTSGFPITLLSLDVQTKYVCYATSKRTIATWRIGTRLQIVHARSAATTTQQIYGSPGEQPYVIAISADHFSSVYRLLNLESTATWHIGTCHESGVPTGPVVLGASLFLVCPFVSCRVVLALGGRGWRTLRRLCTFARTSLCCWS